MTAGRNVQCWPDLSVLLFTYYKLAKLVLLPHTKPPESPGQCFADMLSKGQLNKIFCAVSVMQ